MSSADIAAPNLEAPFQASAGMSSAGWFVSAAPSSLADPARGGRRAPVLLRVLGLVLEVDRQVGVAGSGPRRVGTKPNVSHRY